MPGREIAARGRALPRRWPAQPAAIPWGVDFRGGLAPPFCGCPQPSGPPLGVSFPPQSAATVNAPRSMPSRRGPGPLPRPRANDSSGQERASPLPLRGRARRTAAPHAPERDTLPRHSRVRARAPPLGFPPLARRGSRAAHLLPGTPHLPRAGSSAAPAPEPLDAAVSDPPPGRSSWARRTRGRESYPALPLPGAPQQVRRPRGSLSALRRRLCSVPPVPPDLIIFLVGSRG